MQSNAKTKVAVLGLGGGGGHIAQQFVHIAESGPFEVGVADTDERSLNSRRGVVTIPLGEEWDCAYGCGGDMRLGEKATAATAEALQQFISGASLLIVTAGLGGGTGSGGLRTVAGLAREAQIPTFFLTTSPFAFEGNWRQEQARKAVEPLRQITDSVIVVKSDLLFTTLEADTPAVEAFRMADTLLAKCIHGLAGTIWADWMLTADFAAIRRVLRKYPNNVHLGIGSGTGPNRWQQAIEGFVECPLVGGPDNLKNADAAVVTLLTRAQISVGELQATLSSLQKYLPDKAQVLVGACHSQLASSEVQVTGILCNGTKNDVGAEIADAKKRENGSALESSRRFQKGDKSKTAVQGELPLQEQALGMFSGTRPTSVRGENLDIPTFQRRGIHIDAGD